MVNDDYVSKDRVREVIEAIEAELRDIPRRSKAAGDRGVGLDVEAGVYAVALTVLRGLLSDGPVEIPPIQ
ncbi:hypothetical protein [Pseudactinotalea sp. Z1748]|uniref:hypothetical protein n=1 Tax=Pseudactinotalea sp. Z1748 TaxID=3413027 RepID=UPI003C7B23B3